MYADLFDGLRSHYEVREGVRSDAIFSAAMLLSALASVNLVAALLVVAAFEGRVLHPFVKYGVLLASVGIGGAHILWGRRTSLINRKGPARSSEWKSTFWMYLAVTAVFVIGAGAAYVSAAQ